MNKFKLMDIYGTPHLLIQNRHYFQAVMKHFNQMLFSIAVLTNPLSKERYHADQVLCSQVQN